ncbi:hypothetical protein T265_07632 [Opisthorchis viverrini]|uniref:Uncharacterized protein n=1 Tax=Opisthorchis viverrini TaxID=6198 RepID=A0A074ZGG7_OPIVI|nr:hypothetical protein T265_07632 [Opisthorchis viverrini]KER24742.1 hypothetical protein T265_07632 [Opisthorchis viverrini]
MMDDLDNDQVNVLAGSQAVFDLFTGFSQLTYKRFITMRRDIISSVNNAINFLDSLKGIQTEKFDPPASQRVTAVVGHTANSQKYEVRLQVTFAVFVEKLSLTTQVALWDLRVRANDTSEGNGHLLNANNKQRLSIDESPMTHQLFFALSLLGNHLDPQELTSQALLIVDHPLNNM